MKSLIVLLSTFAIFISISLFFRTSKIYADLYGVNIWPGNVKGARTQFFPQRGNGGNGGIADYLSIVTRNSAGQFWVEAGMIQGGGNWDVDHPAWFWEDMRPYGGGFHIHYISMDIFDLTQRAYVDILPGFYPGSYNIEITSSNSDIRNTSTHNYGYYPSIQMGIDSWCTSGCSMPFTEYTNNQWVGMDTGSRSQHSNGSISVQSPIHAGWVEYPSNSSTGGIFSTYQ